MARAALALTRSQILGHRRRAGALDERLPYSAGRAVEAEAASFPPPNLLAIARAVAWRTARE